MVFGKHQSSPKGWDFVFPRTFFPGVFWCFGDIVVGVEWCFEPLVFKGILEGVENHLGTEM